MLNQYAVERYQSTSDIPTSVLGGMLRRSCIASSCKEGPSIWDTHCKSGNVFSSVPYPHELHQRNSSIEEPLHSSTVKKSERPEQNKDLDRQPKIQSSLVREILQRIMEQTNNDCRFRNFTLTNSPLELRLFAGS